MTDTAFKGFGCADDGTSRYAGELLTGNDPLLDGIRARARAAGLPDIHVSSSDGRHIQVIARAIGAKRVVEIGTLAGYSGVCLLRGMGQGGILHTCEIDPNHAAVARETFRSAGVENQAHIHVGPALQSLEKIAKDGPFDLVFIDADKTGYPAYLDWAAENLRIGGTVLADNVFLWGTLVKDPPDENARAMRGFNQRAVRGDRFEGTLLPTGEGLAMAVRIR